MSLKFYTFMLWGRAIVSAIIKYKSVENVSIAVTIVEATDCSFLLPKYQLLYWLFYPYIFSSQNSWNSQRSATLFWKLSLLSKLSLGKLFDWQFFWNYSGFSLEFRQWIGLNPYDEVQFLASWAKTSQLSMNDVILLTF